MTVVNYYKGNIKVKLQTLSEYNYYFDDYFRDKWWERNREIQTDFVDNFGKAPYEIDKKGKFKVKTYPYKKCKYHTIPCYCKDRCEIDDECMFDTNTAKLINPNIKIKL